MADAAPSVRINLVASYVVQIYVSLAGIVVLPLYLHLMGAESFGLVAWFVMLQGWLLLLDMGLSPTLGREMAQLRAGVVSARDVGRLLHLLERIFAGVAALVAIGMAAGAHWLATRWLRIEHLPVATAVLSIELMAPALALRLCAGLYRGAVGGYERIVWLSAFNATVATARYALIIPWLLFVDASPVGFFAFQLAIAVIEVAIVRLQCHALLRGATARGGAAEAAPPRSIRPVLLLSVSVGVSASLWSVVSQVDKLVLSRLLSLSDYGYFSLVAVAAGGVGLAAAPVTQALSPRLSHLHAGGETAALLRLYRRSTQLITVVAASTGAVVICFAHPLLRAWTGRADVADIAAGTLAFYAAGNVISAVLTMVFFLQFARGDLRMHVRGLLLMLAVLVPSLVAGTLRFGMVGAGAAWLGTNLLYLLVWTARIHRRFAPGQHLGWLIGDVAAISMPALLTAAVARVLIPIPAARLAAVATMVPIGALTLAVAVASSPIARHQARTWFARRRTAG